MMESNLGRVGKKCEGFEVGLFFKGVSVFGMDWKNGDRVKEVMGELGCRGFLGYCKNVGIYFEWDGDLLVCIVF